jgi:hypothetical protein
MGEDFYIGDKRFMGQALLEEDHEAVGKLLDELRAGLRSAIDPQTAYGLLDRVWARLAVHIRAEHLCLFPAVLAARRGVFDGQGDVPSQAEAESAVERLRADHDFFMRELAAAVNTLRGLLSGRGSHDVKAEMEGVRRAVEAVAARLEEHNALEEEQVYRWTRYLPPGEEAQLAVGIGRELTNHPPRFNGDSCPA